jgi:hypothetical protein
VNITFVPGIEVTAIREESDVHILGYFFDSTSPRLLAFLAEQRRERLDRVREIIKRLDALGMHLDADEILKPAVEDPSKSAGRPWIAEKLVLAGHVASVGDAFDIWLARGKPAFVQRFGASPADVIAHLHAAGGVASLAHPVLVGHDEWIAGFAEAGLDAVEAYHSKHDEATTAHYLKMADALDLAVSGGSDFHGHETHGPDRPGAVALPQAAFERLARRAARAATP